LEEEESDQGNDQEEDETRLDDQGEDIVDIVAQGPGEISDEKLVALAARYHRAHALPYRPHRSTKSPSSKLAETSTDFSHSSRMYYTTTTRLSTTLA
jgi:hypothetical protein